MDRCILWSALTFQNVLQATSCKLLHSYTNVILAQQWESMDPIVVQQWVPTLGHLIPLFHKMQQTNGPMQCSSFTLDCEKHVKTLVTTSDDGMKAKFHVLLF